MIFFTRQLYKDMQKIRPPQREWERRYKIRCQYDKVIKPLLPKSVLEFLEKSLHDAEVESVSQESGKIVIVMDARPCASGSYQGSRVRLTFEGVKRRIRTKGLIDQWWLYSEVHLSSRAKFILQVLFTKSELEIEADKFSIRKIK